MSVTETYYDSIAFELSNKNNLYYNGSFLVDIHKDPKTFIDQDVNNIIKLSKMGNSVLECGCGGGYFFKRLIKKKPEINYRGIDLSTKQIEHAKQINPEYESNFMACSWDNLPFEDESFDTILFLETMGYAENPEKMISECYRVLKPGGTLFSKHPGSTYPVEFNKDQVISDLSKLNSFDEGSYNSETGDWKVSRTAEVKSNAIFKIEEEYGYSKNSLGMFMNIPSIFLMLEKYNFSIPDGYIIPNIDCSIHLKLFFIEEVHEFFETFKHYDHTITLRFIDGDKNRFWENVIEKTKNNNIQFEDVLTPLGKKHYNLCYFLFNQIFTATEMRKNHDLMCTSIIFTAIK